MQTVSTMFPWIQRDMLWAKKCLALICLHLYLHIGTIKSMPQNELLAVPVFNALMYVQTTITELL